MRRAITVAVAAVLAGSVTAARAEDGSAKGKAPAPSASIRSVVNIPFTQFKLPNEMAVIFHEDHSQPLVTVNVNVQVGSRDERPGRTGFAHLFEHLMFMGTSRVPTGKFDEWMEREGGSNNAWTSNDRTDYYDVGPRHILPLLLWLEADRLSTLGGLIDKDKLDVQRDVVKNERRQQTENQPYASVRLVLPELLFPKGHPYHHPVIGSHADLTAAGVADVRAFFAEHYTPRNMSLVVAGDFEPAATRKLVERYFGAIPKGQPRGPRRAPAAPAKLTGVVRHTMEDNVTLPKVIMAWPSPALYQSGDAELDLLADVLSSGKQSRLYRALVYDKQLAQSVTAYQHSKGLESDFHVEAVLRPKVTLETIEKAIDEILADVRDKPITGAELSRAKNGWEMRFVSRLQSLASRADALNAYYAAHGTPNWIDKDLQRYLSANATDIQRMAQQVLLPEARVIVHVLPRKQQDTP